MAQEGRGKFLQIPCWQLDRRQDRRFSVKVITSVSTKATFKSGEQGEDEGGGGGKNW